MEKVYVIPLRKAFCAPVTQRAKKAMRVVREFLEKHLKSEDIRVGASINQSVWARSIGKIPRRVRVHAEKDDKGVVWAEMLGVEIKKREEKPKGEAKKEEVSIEEVQENPEKTEVKKEHEKEGAKEKPKKTEGKKK